MSLHNFTTSLQEYAKQDPSNEVKANKVLDWINQYGDFAFVRENLQGHITGSFLVVNETQTKVLLMFHHKLQMWLQFGGHADGEVNISNVALREFHEESGILSEPKILPGIFDIGIDAIPEHKGVIAHTHFDIVYLGIIPENTPFQRQEEEVEDIKWFDIDGIEQYIKEERMLGMLKNLNR